MNNRKPCILSFSLIMLVLLFLAFIQIYFLIGLFSDENRLISLQVSVFLLFSGILNGFLPGFITHYLPVASRPIPQWLTYLNTLLADRIQHKPPMLQIVQSPGVNAFATSNVLLRGRIVIQAEMLHSLTQDEIESVIAHELCHIANGHAATLSFVQGLTMPVSLPLSFVLAAASNRSQSGESFAQSMRQWNSLIGLWCFPLVSLLALYLTRRWEFQADRCAAELVGVTQYVDSLRCLHGSFFQHPNQLQLRENGQADSSLIMPGLSHPDLSQRINALRDIGR